MLFGHQNDDTNQPTQATPATPVTGVNPLAVDPDTGASLPVAPAEPPTPPEPSEPSVLNQPTMPFTDTATTDAPVADSAQQTDPFVPSSAPTVLPQTDDTMVDPSVATDQSTVSNAADATSTEPANTWTPSQPEPSAVPTDTSSDGLLGLKQQALAQLEPLVDQLDQTPEEKFRTTMMLIQSTDNQALIQDAYDAAQAITDEKVRAQALLDVINEINYFTHQAPKQ